MDKYKIDQDNETKIEVAEINSFRGQMDQDINDNGIPDQLEIAKLKEQARATDKKLAVENRKLDVKEKEIKGKERVEKEKLRVVKEEKAKKK